MPTIPLTEADSIAFDCFEPGGDGRSPVRATPHTFNATGSATTVTSAALVGPVDADYVGCLVEPDEGVEAGQVRQVTSFDQGTTTLGFVKGWDTDPTLGGTIAFRMWRPTDAVCRQVGAGSTTTFIAEAADDASGTPGRAEIANFFGIPNRFGLWVRGGTAVDQAALVTADTDGSGGVDKTITVDTGGFVNAPVAGDFAVFRKMLRFVGGLIVTPDLPQAQVERMFAKGAQANDEADANVTTRIRRDTAITGAELEIQPVSSVASGATLATPPAEACDHLESLFDFDADGATAIDVSDGAATTTTLRVTHDTNDRFGMGNLVLVEGEMRQIRTLTSGAVGPPTVTDTMVVAPALSATPQDAVAVTGGCNYTPINSGFRSHTYEFFLGGKRIMVQGWLPNVEIQGILGESHGKWVLGGPADSHWEDGWDYPDLTTSQGGDRFPVNSIEVPILAGRSSVMLDTTEISDVVLEVKLDLGYKFAALPVVGTFGGNDGVRRNGRRETVGTVKVHIDDLSYFKRYQKNSTHSLLLQLGSAIGGTFGWIAPVIEFVGQPYAAEDGSYTQEIPFRVLGTGINGVTTAVGPVVTTTRIPGLQIGLI